MSPTDVLCKRVMELLKNVMETIRSPIFLFFAGMHSFLERFKRD